MTCMQGLSHRKVTQLVYCNCISIRSRMQQYEAPLYLSLLSLPVAQLRRFQLRKQ